MERYVCIVFWFIIRNLVVSLFANVIIVSTSTCYLRAEMTLWT